MKIVYVAKFDQPDSNDDEGAILHALRELGHEVRPLREVAVGTVHRITDGADFLLCHHLADPALLGKVSILKVFWCFDLIDWPQDRTLAGRCGRRKDWVSSMTAACNLGFMSDGDWVANDESGKLHVLRQGADERVVGRGSTATRCEHCGHEEPAGRTWDVAMFGIGRGGGVQRESFVQELKDRYGDRFLHVEKGVHGRKLADLIARCKVVVAPDSPVTDRYWSNRVYVMLGFGAMLVHPYCKELMHPDYSKGAVFYGDRAEMHKQIGILLGQSGLRKNISDIGLARTLESNLYRHRCAKLIQTAKERLG